MVSKVSHKVVCPSNINEPCKILLGEEAVEAQGKEELEKRRAAFQSRYYAPVMEQNLYDNVGGWLRVQDLRRIAAGGLDFDLGLNNPFSVFNNSDLIKEVYQRAGEHLHWRLGMKDIDFSFKTNGAQGSTDPMIGSVLFFNVSHLPVGRYMYDLDNYAFLRAGNNLEGFTKLLIKNAMATVIHETTHIDQFSYPGLEEEIIKVFLLIDSVFKETKLDLRITGNFYKASPEEINQAFSQFIESVRLKDPKLAEKLQKGIDIKRLSRISFKTEVKFSDLVRDSVIGGVVLPWLQKRINLSTEGFSSVAGRVLLAWHEFRNRNYRNIEAEAHLAHHLFENSTEEYTYKDFDLKYKKLDHSQDETERPRFPFSKYRHLDPSQDERLRGGLAALINNKAFVYGVHGADLFGNLMFALDVANAAHDFQNFDEAPGRAIYSGGKAFVSTGSGILGTAAILSNNPILRVSARRISGPAGAVLSLGHSIEQDIDDFGRWEEVSALEHGLDVLGTVGNSALLVGAAWGVALVFFSVASGGILIPALLVSGGMAVGLGSEAGHAEAQEERVAEGLAQALKQFDTSVPRSSDQIDALWKIAKLLANEYGELDDDAFMDFFELAKSDPYLKQNLIRILKNPTLAPLREKIVEQLISPKSFSYFPGSAQGFLFELGKFLSYQRDEEGAYGMLIALLHQKETEGCTKGYVHEIASRLDSSDWVAFIQLVNEYGLNLNELDPYGWLRGYRPMTPSEKFQTGSIF